MLSAYFYANHISTVRAVDLMDPDRPSLELDPEFGATARAISSTRTGQLSSFWAAD